MPQGQEPRPPQHQTNPEPEPPTVVLPGIVQSGGQGEIVDRTRDLQSPSPEAGLDRNYELTNYDEYPEDTPPAEIGGPDTTTPGVESDSEAEPARSSGFVVEDPESGGTRRFTPYEFWELLANGSSYSELWRKAYNMAGDVNGACEENERSLRNRWGINLGLHKATSFSIQLNILKDRYILKDRSTADGDDERKYQYTPYVFSQRTLAMIKRFPNPEAAQQELVRYSADNFVRVYQELKNGRTPAAVDTVGLFVAANQLAYGLSPDAAHILYGDVDAEQFPDPPDKYQAIQEAFERTGRSVDIEEVKRREAELLRESSVEAMQSYLKNGIQAGRLPKPGPEDTLEGWAVDTLIRAYEDGFPPVLGAIHQGNLVNEPAFAILMGAVISHIKLPERRPSYTA